MNQTQRAVASRAIMASKNRVRNMRGMKEGYGMAKYIDETFWWEALGKPDWYLLLANDFERLEQLAEKRHSVPEHKEIKREAYALVEKAIRKDHLPVASKGINFDIARKPIDTIILHHTKNPAGMTLERLNAIQLLRIYGRHFANPTDQQEQHLKGQAIWSGHFYQNKQVFWGYHWLIRDDGSSEHILEDRYIGWHAGNWGINMRSVGICIDDDLSEKKPSETVLKAVAAVIQQHYPKVKIGNILGHGDVNTHTACPGHLFHTQWRQALLDKLV